MEVFVAMILALGAIAFVAYPLLKPQAQLATEAAGNGMVLDADLEETISKRDSIYAAMKELEFDKAIGNLSDGDYNELRERYKRKAISILQEIDGLEQSRGKRASRRRKASHEEVIEEGVAAAPAPRAKATTKKGAGTVRSCQACGARLTPKVRFCVECGAEVVMAANACPECGTTLQKTDRFCGGCGAQVKGE